MMLGKIFLFTIAAVAMMVLLVLIGGCFVRIGLAIVETIR